MYPEATRRVPNEWFERLPNVLVSIVQAYFNNDTRRETLMTIAGSSNSALAHLVLAPECIPHVICNYVDKDVYLNLPASIESVCLRDVSVPVSLDLSRLSLHRFRADRIHHFPEWIRRFEHIRSIEHLDLFNIKKDGQVSFGALPVLRRMCVGNLSNSVSLEGGENLHELTISLARDPLSIKGIKSGVNILQVSCVSGDYDFRGLPDTLYRINLSGLNSFDLALLVGLPEDLQVLHVQFVAGVRWSGSRANGDIVCGNV